MSKHAISVTLHRDNLTWLKARAGAIGARSVSDLLDQLVSELRRKETSDARKRHKRRK